MGTLLFGVAVGPDFKTAASQLKMVGSAIDGIELRLDYFHPFTQEELSAFMKSCEIPVMLTLRRCDQGGYFQGTEEERLHLLESFCALGPAYVDLEYDVPEDFRKKLFDSYPHTIFLSSYHDFSGAPDLEEIYAKIKTPHAHIHKIAITAKSSIDALKLLNFVKSHAKEKIIGISMGEKGEFARILSPVVGSALAYAMLPSGGATAPGQLTAQELQETYHFSRLNLQTAIYCLIGDPVSSSLGAIAHNAAFENIGVNAVYVKICIKKEEAEAFFSFAETLPFEGISVTMPLKEVVLPFLAHVSPEVKVMAACNTIKKEKGGWIGYNTDGIGALNALERKASISGKHVVIAGAGGAAKAIAYEALRRGALVTLLNRTESKALEIARALGCRGGGWELFPEVVNQGYDVLINCTPDGDLINEEWILHEKIAMDIVYIPKNTPFLVKASRNRCRLVFGYEMFVGQALEQERIWLPDKIPLDKAYMVIEDAALHCLK